MGVEFRLRFALARCGRGPGRKGLRRYSRGRGRLCCVRSASVARGYMTMWYSQRDGPFSVAPSVCLPSFFLFLRKIRHGSAPLFLTNY
jgi:hypothetical protein